jgi:hypothetical protein
MHTLTEDAGNETLVNQYIYKESAAKLCVIFSLNSEELFRMGSD